MRAVLSGALGDWQSPSPAALARAVRESPDAITLPPPGSLATALKSGALTAYKLVHADVYFTLRQEGERKTISHIINNAHGTDPDIVHTAVLAKAVEAGATHLECFAVKTEKFPKGLLPEIFAEFGFSGEESAKAFDRTTFDAQWKATGQPSDKKFADLLKNWQAEGWDLHSKPPEIVTLRLDEKLQNHGARRRYYQQMLGHARDRMAGAFDTRQTSKHKNAQSHPANSRSGGVGVDDAGQGPRPQGVDSPLLDSASGSNPTRFRTIAGELTDLGDDTAKKRGLDLKQLERLRPQRSKR